MTPTTTTANNPSIQSSPPLKRQYRIIIESAILFTTQIIATNNASPSTFLSSHLSLFSTTVSFFLICDLQTHSFHEFDGAASGSAIKEKEENVYMFGGARNPPAKRDDGIMMGAALMPTFFSSVATATTWNVNGVGGITPIMEVYARCAALGGMAYACSNLYVWICCRKMRWSPLAIPIRRINSGAIIVTIFWIVLFLFQMSGFTENDGREMLVMISFGMAYSICTWIYYCKNSTESHPYPSSSICSSNTYVSKILSSGEWNTISIGLSILLSDWVVWNVFHILPSRGCGGNSNDGSDGWVHHLVISQSGLLGCLVGCFVSSWITRDRAPHSCTGSKNTNQTIMCGQQLLIVALVALGFVEGSLHVCPGSALSNRLWFVPACLHWIVTFLMDSHHNASSLSFSSSSMLSGLPQYACLLYWTICMLFVFPFAVRLAKQRRFTASSSSLSMPRKKNRPAPHKMVVVHRKLFHAVAILLFLPGTLYMPNMMSLSYAVAISLLILLEHIRTGTIGRNATEWKNETSLTKKVCGTACFTMNDFYLAFMDEKDETDGFVITHAALISGCAIPLWVDRIVHALTTVEQIEKGASPFHFDTFLLPHVGLIVLGIGDAAGAIIGTYYGKHPWFRGCPKTLEGSGGMIVSMLLYVSITWTIHTVTQTSLIGIEWWDVFSCGFALCILTLLEACTNQIDNLCLPIAGVSMLLNCRARNNAS